VCMNVCVCVCVCVCARARVRMHAHKLCNIFPSLSHINLFFISDVKVVPNSKSLKPDRNIYNSAYSSDIVSDKMKLNFQILLDKHPDGIWCSELPYLYKVNCTVTVVVVLLFVIKVPKMCNDYHL
jgi:hypothetical protein